MLYQCSALFFACVLGSIWTGFRTEIGYKRVPNTDRESIRKSTFRQECHFKPSWTIVGIILVTFLIPFGHLLGSNCSSFGSRFGSFWFHFCHLCYYFNLVYIFSVRCNLGRLFVPSLLSFGVPCENYVGSHVGTMRELHVGTHVGSIWEPSMGTMWEPCRNHVGTMWEIMIKNHVGNHSWEPCGKRVGTM